MQPVSRTAVCKPKTWPFTLLPALLGHGHGTLPHPAFQPVTVAGVLLSFCPLPGCCQSDLWGGQSVVPLPCLTLRASCFVSMSDAEPG